MTDSKPALVLDNGSDTTKAGFAREEAPHTVLTSVVGYEKHAKFQEVWDRNDPLIGQDSLDLSSNLDLKYPIKNSIITNWDDMEMVSRVHIKFERSCGILYKASVNVLF